MKIEKYQLVTSFTPNSEIFYNAVFPLLKKRLKGRLVNLNVPSNSPPETPRLVISSNDTVLNVGLTRFDIHIQLPNHIREDSESCLDYLRVKSDSMLETLFNELKVSYTWSGLVSNIKFPFEGKKPANKIAISVFDHLINVDRKERKLSSFNLQFGFSEGDINRLYTVSGYESRDIKVPPLKVGQSLRVDLASLPIVESGIQVLLDVNNKPNIGKNSSPLDDIKNLCKSHEASYETIKSDLNLAGVL